MKLDSQPFRQKAFNFVLPEPGVIALRPTGATWVVWSSATIYNKVMNSTLQQRFRFIDSYGMKIAKALIL